MGWAVKKQSQLVGESNPTMKVTFASKINGFESFQLTTFDYFYYYQKRKKGDSCTGAKRIDWSVEISLLSVIVGLF